MANYRHSNFTATDRHCRRGTLISGSEEGFMARGQRVSWKGTRPTVDQSPAGLREVYALTPPSTMANPAQGATMDCILQEISAVGCKLEGMDNAMASLTAETKSMCLDIAGFQSRLMGLE
ncbi:hypothetical protein NDU88_002932 [Pleurodeles waltl]|uniref:Uncharacterized protein n=1 Tax=Pleurodeles waltl TaxID=8319 RepID=A0AAV7VEP2_PLEWA|nr:hypothetical protein NDU88_002932 [Pleurodeles waltl]